MDPELPTSSWTPPNADNGSGGGGGGGFGSQYPTTIITGGGVGIYGQGENGIGGYKVSQTQATAGSGGSGKNLWWRSPRN